MSPEIMHINLLLIERNRLYNKSEKQRKIFKFDDRKIIKFAIRCCEYSIQTKDWRYLNLAFKIIDSENIIADKNKLKLKAELSFKVLKKSVL